MQSETKEGSNLRAAVKANAPGLTAIAIVSGVIGALWLWLGVAGLLARGISGWIIFPVGIFGAVLCGSVTLWALRRRAIDEPALIIDEVGIYDNVSMARAGRVRWREMERAWIAGPSWHPILCILPENASDFIAKQDEVRGAAMRFNYATVHAPIVIPMATLAMPPDDVWKNIVQAVGAPRQHGPTASRFAAGAR